MLQILKRRRFRKESNLLFIKQSLEEEFRFNDTAKISIRNGQVKFHYELYDHSFAGSMQSEGFTAYIDDDFTTEVIHYKILHDEFVDMSSYDRVYACKDISEVVDTLFMVIEGEL